MDNISGSGQSELEFEDIDNISCISLLYDTKVFKGIAALRSAVALFSFLCCVTVIFLICYYKKYQFFPQRLILYLAVVSTVHSIVFIVGRVNYHATREVADTLCMVVGFIALYASWVELLLIACITTHLFLLLVLGVETSQKEVLHLLVSFILPLLWCWIPFIENSFGSSGPWCGIRIHNEVDCGLHLFGGLLRFFLWHIPLYTFFLIFFLSCLLAILFKLNKDSLEWEGDPQKQETKQKIIAQVKPLIFYPMIFVLFKLPLLINHLYETIDPQEPVPALWFFDALTSPLGGAVVPLVYVCDANTRTKLRVFSREIRPRLHECCGFGSRETPGVVDYSVEADGIFGDSMEGELARRRLRQQSQLSKISNLTNEHSSSDNTNNENNIA